MRIYIGVSGVGRGHAMRTSRLAHYLLNRGASILISTYGDGVDAIELNGLGRWLCTVEPYEYVWGDKGLEWLLTIAHSLSSPHRFLKHFKDEMSCISRFSPDLVVSDSRISTIIAALVLGKPSVVVANQLSIFHLNSSLRRIISSGFKAIWGSAKKILVTDLPPPYTVSYVNVVPYLHRYGDKVHFVGLLDDLEKYRSPPPSDKRNIDVTFVVSAPKGDRVRYARTVVKLASLLGDAGYKVVVLGEKMLVGSGKNVALLGWVDNPLEYIMNSKTVFVRGGQTTILEAILSSTPMIISPAPMQTEQEGNAASVKRMGLGEVIPYHELLGNLDAAPRIVEDMLLNIDGYFENLEKVRKVALQAGGVEKAVDILLSFE